MKREPRGSRSVCLGGVEVYLATYGDASFIAPLADAGVADFEDGFIGPFLWCGGQRGAVDVVRGGIGDEVGITSSAIDEELQRIHPLAEPVPLPAEVDVITTEFDGEAGLHEAEIGHGGGLT